MKPRGESIVSPALAVVIGVLLLAVVSGVAVVIVAGTAGFTRLDAPTAGP